MKKMTKEGFELEVARQSLNRLTREKSVLARRVKAKNILISELQQELGRRNRAELRAFLAKI